MSKQKDCKANRKCACSDYILFAPLYCNSTYLINRNGEVVHMWENEFPPSNAAYLLEDGTLLRTCSPSVFANESIRSTAVGFYVQKISREGKIIWNFKYSDEKYRLHHDIKPMPNGNILMLVYEKKTAKEAIAAGRNPDLLKEEFLLSERIIEVKPEGKEDGEIVWSWSLWDHLVQDFDNSKDNFGDVANHPELLDINFVSNDKPDWVHLNSIDYNVEKDQILLSSRTLSEIWIIDHSASEKESRGHIIYRWGNPQVYKRGTKKDQKLFGQHDAQWIEKGCLGEGNILIFNNGDGRPDGEYSSVEEIVPSEDKDGNYVFLEGGSYGPENPVWSFSSGDGEEFFSQHISGAQRLENGNTLICVGGKGYFFEITSEGKKVWDYQNKFCDDDIYKKKIKEVEKYTTSPKNNPSRKKEAVFKIRRY